MTIKKNAICFMDNPVFVEYFKVKQEYENTKSAFQSMTILFNMGNMPLEYHQTFVKKYLDARKELIMVLDKFTEKDKDILIKEILIPF